MNAEERVEIVYSQALERIFSLEIWEREAGGVDKMLPGMRRELFVWRWVKWKIEKEESEQLADRASQGRRSK